ncbi:MAG: DUF1015 domain-containing protein [Anaerolineae bacterium]|nr:DUF1015 domain-containing protein [Anaerolineae bacterium]
MAVIKPFRGVRYNPDRIDDLSAVTSQPYDRISPELAARYRARSPYNITDIILGHNEDEGMPGENCASAGVQGDVYHCALHNYQDWLAQDILIREEAPAVYAYEQTFSVGGQEYVRLGMIAAVELADFAEGIILPHERTHSGPKLDRLHLLRALEVNTEQIFMLYPDPENRVNALLRQAIGDRDPDIDVVEMFEHDVRQRVWVIRDPETLAAITGIMAPMRGLIIADGHHRYETALTYRQEQQARHADIPPDAALNFVGATLVSMDDPGLVVLPTHREIRNFSERTPAEVLARAGEHFAITPAPDLEDTLAAVNAAPDGLTFGFYGGPEVGFHILRPQPGFDPAALIADDRSATWKGLAVSVLHRVLLEQVAGVPAAGIDDKSMVRYHRDPQQPVENIDAGRGEFAFFLSPTTIEQIKTVAGNGEKMPQKSTDFYPKMISGLTMLPVGPDEHLENDQRLSHQATLPASGG